MQQFEQQGLQDMVHLVASTNTSRMISIHRSGEYVLEESLGELKSLWWQTTHALQRLRDNPQCADEETCRYQQP